MLIIRCTGCGHHKTRSLNGAPRLLFSLLADCPFTAPCPHPSSAEIKDSRASWLNPASLLCLPSQGFSRFCQPVFGVSLTSLSARESGWMSRSGQVLSSGCSQHMRGRGLPWMLPLDGRDFPFQFTKHLLPRLSKNCSSHLSRGFESLETPQRSAPALDLHQFSLSVWRMLCPGRTMGIVDAEKSHRQA